MAEIKSCDFTQCGDGNGVLHWMGTKKGAEPWQNPQTAGEVEICMSSCGAGQPSMVADQTFTDQVCETKNETSSWIGVDLKTAECCPTIYTFAHRPKSTEGFIRSWYFQGSTDGVSWEDLDDRTDDATMTEEALWAAYAITPTEKFFRFFRIKMKPQGNTTKTETLTMCCFEIYGKARKLAGGVSGAAAGAVPAGAVARGGGVAPAPYGGGAGYQPYGAPPGGYGGGKGVFGGPPPGKGPPGAFGGKGGGFPKGGDSWRQGTNQESVPSPHPPGQTNFDWQFNGDKRGVVFYLGTGCGTTNWRNPCTTGAVMVKMSSLWAGRPEMITDHTLTNQVLFTRHEPESWVAVDLLTVKVCPNGYSFAHRSDMPKYFARNWLFQGSNDGHNWDTIYQHQRDETISERCLHGSWAVQSQGYYRMFRVYMSGDGNSRGTNTLVVTCFDVYGTTCPA
eukprot:TRINITY_DN354_c0_g2_i1.p1 TRINITY_DN354_c0_g2~~TRINITY_DN354_c0_g2_i1.p1  ORF type:complete len:449 (+),score=121.19 TRINITY_DN354_c0_g2_i1:96-1442(+)